MGADDTDSIQDEVVTWLRQPGVIGTGAAEEIETHISRIFLSGERVMKLKRALKFPYLDFSTPERRRADCEAEVALNRRTAPDIYLGVVAVTREPDGTLAFDGTGEPVEWLVHMRRFPEDAILHNVAAAGNLKRVQIVDLAEHIASFHASAEVHRDRGGKLAAETVYQSNMACFAAVSPRVPDPTDVNRLNKETGDVIEALATDLDARAGAGALRTCHGDLHLQNICLLDGRPTLYDAIEFNPAFNRIDVLYDLAFLLMDLEFHGMRRLANIAFNRYMDSTGEVTLRPASLSVLPLFLSLRAGVRAHVAATRAAASPDLNPADVDQANRYLRLALGYLEPTTPRLIAVGGLSGSGKSRLARELAPFFETPIGARVVRTDAVRKRISGVAQEDRLGKEGYTAEMHTKTYDAFYAEIRTALQQGHDVIADAVFPGPDQRAVLATIAEECGVDFQGIWVEAPLDVRLDRVNSRKRNISDVTEEVARAQEDYDLGKITWDRVDSSGPRENTVKRGREIAGLDDRASGI